MKFFIKVNADTQNKLSKYLCENPLLYVIVHEAAKRARKTDGVGDDLKKDEFYFSQTEYKRFGLRKSQHGILARAIKKAVELKIFEKIGNQIGNKKRKNNPSIFRFNWGLYDYLSVKDERETGNQIGNQQVTNRYPIGNQQVGNKSIKKEKNEKIKNMFDEPPDNKKKKFMEFVFLKDEEYKKLIEKFGEEATKTEIYKLNNYIGSKGVKYKSHYHTILNWNSNKEKKIMVQGLGGQKKEVYL